MGDFKGEDEGEDDNSMETGYNSSPVCDAAEDVWNAVGHNTKIARQSSFSVVLNYFIKNTTRRGVRVAEGARLESVFTRNRDVGSNPTLSASPSLAVSTS